MSLYGAQGLSRASGLGWQNAGKVTVLQRFRAVRRAGYANNVAAARCAIHSDAVQVFHSGYRKQQVAGWRNQLKLVAWCEFVLHIYGRPFTVVMGDGAHHLLCAQVGGASLV